MKYARKSKKWKTTDAESKLEKISEISDSSLSELESSGKMIDEEDQFSVLEQSNGPSFDQLLANPETKPSDSELIEPVRQNFSGVSDQ